MNVKRLDFTDPAALARWDALARERGRPYHNTGWARVIEGAYGFLPHYLYGEENGELVSLFPLFMVSRPLGGWHGVSLPHVEAAGVLGIEGFPDYLDYLRWEGWAAELTILQCAEPLQGFPAREHEAILVKRLPATVDGIIPSLATGTARNTMRQALRRHYTTEVGCGEELLAPFYHLYLEKMREFGTPPHGLRFFHLLLSEFAGRCAIILLRDGQGVPLAAGLVVGAGETLSCVALVAVARELRMKTGYALMHEVMAHAIGQGYRTLVLGRCEKDSGNYRYKLALGGVPLPLYRYQLDATPAGYQARLVTTAKERYRGLAAIWSHLPAPATDRLGPVLRKWIY